MNNDRGCRHEQVSTSELAKFLDPMIGPFGLIVATCGTQNRNILCFFFYRRKTQLSILHVFRELSFLAGSGDRGNAGGPGHF